MPVPSTMKFAIYAHSCTTISFSIRASVIHLSPVGPQYNSPHSSQSSTNSSTHNLSWAATPGVSPFIECCLLPTAGQLLQGSVHSLSVACCPQLGSCSCLLNYQDTHIAEKQ
ncbi:uncharacterized protein [Cherax quadricarinatus]|uniref:uncharacterized protein isoform X2 n=1 Tax=Cherax quadricarinatus TaxID=27406 RepID=UPI00387E7730